MTQQSAAVALVVRGSAAGLAYLLQVVLAQLLGAHEYGLYAYAWIWVMIGGRLGMLGFGQASIRFIAEYRDSGRLPVARGYVVASQRLVLFGSMGLAALGLAGLYLFESVVTSVYVMPLYLTMICVPLFALQGLMEGQALAWSWTGLASAPPYLLRQVLIMVFLVGAVLFGAPPTAVSAMTAVIAGAAAATLVQYIVLSRRMRKSLDVGHREMRLRYWLKTAAPLFLLDSFQLSLAFVDILVLGLFVEPALVAIYFAATRVNALIGLIQVAVASAAGQRFAGIAANRDDDRLKALIRNTLRWTFWPTLVVALGIVTGGWLLLRMFGAEFTEAYPLLPILAVGMLARASVGPAENLLIMLGHERSAFAAQAWCTIGNVALNFTLIPLYGIYGAAIATSLSLVLYTIALEIFVRRSTGHSCWVATA